MAIDLWVVQFLILTLYLMTGRSLISVSCFLLSCSCRRSPVSKNSPSRCWLARFQLYFPVLLHRFFVSFWLGSYCCFLRSSFFFFPARAYFLIFVRICLGVSLWRSKFSKLYRGKWSWFTTIVIASFIVRSIDENNLIVDVLLLFHIFTICYASIFIVFNYPPHHQQWQGRTERIEFLEVQYSQKWNYLFPRHLQNGGAN